MAIRCGSSSYSAVRSAHSSSNLSSLGPLHIFIAYPLIVTPAFYQVFIAEKLVPGFAALMDVVQVVWIGFHCVLWRQSCS